MSSSWVLSQSAIPLTEFQVKRRGVERPLTDSLLPPRTDSHYSRVMLWLYFFARDYDFVCFYDTFSNSIVLSGDEVSERSRYSAMYCGEEEEEVESSAERNARIEGWKKHCEYMETDEGINGMCERLGISRADYDREEKNTARYSRNVVSKNAWIGILSKVDSRGGFNETNISLVVDAVNAYYFYTDSHIDRSKLKRIPRGVVIQAVEGFARCLSVNTAHEFVAGRCVEAYRGRAEVKAVAGRAAKGRAAKVALAEAVGMAEKAEDAAAVARMATEEGYWHWDEAMATEEEFRQWVAENKEEAVAGIAANVAAAEKKAAAAAEVVAECRQRVEAGGLEDKSDVFYELARTALGNSDEWGDGEEGRAYCAAGLRCLWNTIIFRLCIDSADGVSAPLLAVLESSEQGIGKSDFVGNMVPPSMYSDGGGEIFAKSARDAAPAMAGLAVIELAEAVGMAKKSAAEIKSFISQSHFKGRMAYEREAGKIPIRATFVATTNNLNWNFDGSGGRRFLPFRLNGQMDLSFLKGNWMALLGQAYEANRVLVEDANGVGFDRALQERVRGRCSLGNELWSYRDAVVEKRKGKTSFSEALERLTDRELIIERLDLDGALHDVVMLRDGVYRLMNKLALRAFLQDGLRPAGGNAPQVDEGRMQAALDLLGWENRRSNYRKSIYSKGGKLVDSPCYMKVVYFIPMSADVVDGGDMELESEADLPMALDNDRIGGKADGSMEPGGLH